MKKAPYFIAAYALVALFTFGHVYVRQPATYDAWGAVKLINTPERKAFGAAFACLMWPFYWSIEIQEQS